MAMMSVMKTLHGLQHELKCINCQLFVKIAGLTGQGPPENSSVWLRVNTWPWKGLSMGLRRLHVAARLNVPPAINAPECARWRRTVCSGCGCASARYGWAVAPSRLAAGCCPGAPAGPRPRGRPSSCSPCLPGRRCCGAVRLHRRSSASTYLPSTRGIRYSRMPI